MRLTLGSAALLLAAGIWAGVQNALAGGGTFVTLPALIVTGMDALSANITSTVAMFPGQVATGLMGRTIVRGAESLSFKALFVISLVGGGIGAILLLVTPASIFERMVPWLVLFATAVFAWGSFGRKGADAPAVALGPAGAALVQLLIAIYGGYFGGGIGFLMLAALSLAGLPTRSAGATKNALAGVMNASAVAVFALSPKVHWASAAILAAGAVVGGIGGGWMLHRVNETMLRLAVVAIGVALTVGLFARPV